MAGPMVRTVSVDRVHSIYCIRGNFRGSYISQKASVKGFLWFIFH